MMNTNELSLEVAMRLTEIVNDAWADGSMLEAVTPTTKELLKWWFSEEQCSIRKRNFHEGQRQGDGHRRRLGHSKQVALNNGRCRDVLAWR